MQEKCGNNYRMGTGGDYTSEEGKKRREAREKVAEWMMYILLLSGVILLIPMWISWGAPGWVLESLVLPFFKRIEFYFLALIMTLGPPILYFFVLKRKLPFRILSTLKFHGRMKVSDLASRFSTTETDIESAIKKLKSRGEQIRFNMETEELIYIPFKEFAGIVDVFYGSQKCTAFFASDRVIVGRITRDELHKLEDVSPETILKSDARNFALPYCDIAKVEMWTGPRLGMKIYGTDKEKYEFGVVDPSVFDHDYYTGKTLSYDFMNLMRTVFQDKLSLEQPERKTKASTRASIKAFIKANLPLFLSVLFLLILAFFGFLLGSIAG